MPILAREPDCFPDNLFESAENLPPGQSWWVFYTIARREKELVRRLRAERITCYCPQLAQRQRSPAGRIRTSYVPMFGGYVFASGTDDDRQAALASNCVSRCLPVADGAELFRDLSQIWRLTESGAPLTPEDRLEPGQRVTVRRGPLAGFHGTVVQRRSGHRLIVAVNFLQRGVSALLDDTDVAAS
jgi:transcriptional antiterminator RfaH